jgi:BRCT domain type II-containing protein
MRHKDVRRNRGRRATPTISGETDDVVPGKNPGQKLREEKQSDIRIINEQEFKRKIDD